jgi:hypothetical protein
MPILYFSCQWAMAYWLAYKHTSGSIYTLMLNKSTSSRIISAISKAGIFDAVYSEIAWPSFEPCPCRTPTLYLISNTKLWRNPLEFVNSHSRQVPAWTLQSPDDHDHLRCGTLLKRSMPLITSLQHLARNPMNHAAFRFPASTR